MCDCECFHPQGFYVFPDRSVVGGWGGGVAFVHSLKTVLINDVVYRLIFSCLESSF